MTFNFNATQTVSDLSSLSSCLNQWSKKVPTFSSTKEGDHLAISILKNGISMPLRIKEATAKHECKRISESTAFGPPEMSKRYTLEVNGKDVQGKAFNLSAYFFTDSEDGGRTWSGFSRNITLKSNL